MDLRCLALKKVTKSSYVGGLARLVTLTVSTSRPVSDLSASGCFGQPRNPSVGVSKLPSAATRIFLSRPWSEESASRSHSVSTSTSTFATSPS